MTQMENAIEVNNLSKSYGGLFKKNAALVLKDLSLSVPQNSIYGLMGPNGAGKTTFIKALLGILLVDEGEISLFGKSPELALSRKEVSYLPEKIYFIPNSTPKSFLSEIARFRSISNIKQEIEKQLSRVQLLDKINFKVSKFSKGMKQRLGLAAALMGKPKMLILDEPTDGIDPLGRAQIREIIFEERKRGATVFLNSHLLSETQKICDHIAILYQGKIIKSGLIQEVCKVQEAWKIKFNGPLNSEAIESFGFSPGKSEEQWLFKGSSSVDLNLALDKARASGAILLELSTHELELEEVLINLINQELSSQW